MYSETASLDWENSNIPQVITRLPRNLQIRDILNLTKDYFLLVKAFNTGNSTKEPSIKETSSEESATLGPSNDIAKHTRGPEEDIPKQIDLKNTIRRREMSKEDVQDPGVTPKQK